MRLKEKEIKMFMMGSYFEIFMGKEMENVNQSEKIICARLVEELIFDNYQDNGELSYGDEIEEAGEEINRDQCYIEGDGYESYYDEDYDVEGQDDDEEDSYEKEDDDNNDNDGQFVDKSEVESNESGRVGELEGEQLNLFFY
ncbi:MAG: hypothetical protein EZS28_001522 [Streblomastix strix]|uniref:Uncharacterized protein n=1 Tax=Streblomastix strix TaxID=222440 RepID=A0A5J4X8U1_9EUKA|nr:MAG: hypothetical protein EZS28_001522 [Streblomastix strix]